MHRLMSHREGLSTWRQAFPGNRQGASPVMPMEGTTRTRTRGTGMLLRDLQLCSNQTAYVPPHEGALWAFR